MVPYQGAGQGNGAAPACWNMISTPIVNMMRTAGFGFLFLTALTATAVSFVCYAFVDDTDVIHTARSPDVRGEVILQEMQEVVDMWEGGLRATGGAIVVGGDGVPYKSFWCLTDFQWENGKWRHATTDDIPGDITVRDVDGTARVTLKRLECDDAIETLGVFLAMDGNNDAEAVKLRKEAELFADQVRTGTCARDDACVALQTTINENPRMPHASHHPHKKTMGLCYVSNSDGNSAKNGLHTNLSSRGSLCTS